MVPAAAAAAAAEVGLAALRYPAEPVAGVHRNSVASEPGGNLVGLALVLEERSRLERHRQVEQKPAEHLDGTGTR